MNKQDLKIEFSAAPWIDNYYVLEYRISPHQDRTYKKTISLFFGLIKFSIKRKHSTKWQRPYKFFYCSSSYLYSFNDGFNWNPILVDDQDDLNSYKRRFDTYGQFECYLNDLNKDNIERYWKDRYEHFNKERPRLY